MDSYFKTRLQEYENILQILTHHTKSWTGIPDFVSDVIQYSKLVGQLVQTRCEYTELNNKALFALLDMKSDKLSRLKVLTIAIVEDDLVDMDETDLNIIEKGWESLAEFTKGEMDVFILFLLTLVEKNRGENKKHEMFYQKLLALKADLETEFTGSPTKYEIKKRLVLKQQMKDLIFEIEDILNTGISNWMGVLQFIDTEFHDKFSTVRKIAA